MTGNASPEKALLSAKIVEMEKVSQPERSALQKVDGLGEFLTALNGLEMGNIGESTGEDTSARDLGGAGGGFVATGSSTTTVSARDLAIANLPVAPVMQKQLEAHIEEEVKKLRRQAKQVSRISTPGAAYHLTKIYARIRQFHTLLAALLDAGVEVVKRFFIRVFIDRQPIL